MWDPVPGLGVAPAPPPPCIESTESEPLDHREVPIIHFIIIFFDPPHGMCDLNSPTRDQTCALCSGSAKSTTGPRRKSQLRISKTQYCEMQP